MKIIDVRTVIAGNPWKNWHFAIQEIFDEFNVEWERRDPNVEAETH